MSRVMKAMVLTGHGGLDRYEWREDWPVPVPGSMEVLIGVGACGLNNTDVNTRTGWYSRTVTDATTGDARAGVDTGDADWGGRPIRFPRIQGADVVGEAVAVGEGADPGVIGKRVMVDAWLRDRSDPENPDKAGYFGSEIDGGFAEYARCDARNLAVVESDLTDAELATFSCSYTTAEGMLNRASVGAGDTVLVPGASGGVGGALIQLAKRRGARAIAMASEAKHAGVAKLGPDLILPRAPRDLREALEGETVTVVADVVGGPGWPALIDILARGGRYTCSGAIAGPVVALDLRSLYLRDLTFTGSTVVPSHVFRDVVGYIERGEVRPVLAATWPLSERAPVLGICVRRDAASQGARVAQVASALAAMIECSDAFDAGDVDVSDAVLAPGYGRLNEAVREAMAMAAGHEGLLLDPVYTGKAMAGLIAHVRSGRIAAGSRVLFVHTGGQPALFAYADSLGSWLSEAPDGPAR